MLKIHSYILYNLFYLIGTGKSVHSNLLVIFPQVGSCWCNFHQISIKVAQQLTPITRSQYLRLIISNY